METISSENLLPCVCKGIRSCNLCKPEKDETDVHQLNDGPVFIYCDGCRQAVRMDVYESHSACPHAKDSINGEICFPIEGIFLIPDFLDEEEELRLIERIDTDVWIPSQSGRLKQDFGIKINFKKQTIKTKYFTGMPNFSVEFIERFQKHRLLKDFQSVELCNLDYRPERGSHIDPHIDDVWIWGERLITINLLSNTILTLISNDLENPKTIYIPLPRRWLIVLYADARYEYKHAIQRQHIHERRVAVTFRELTSKNEKFYEENKELYEKILRIGQRYTGISVGRFEQLTNLYQHQQITEEQICPISDDEIDKIAEKCGSWPSNGSLAERAQFLAKWRLATREQTGNLPMNYLDEVWWQKTYSKIVEEKKTNYPLLLSNLFTCEDEMKSLTEKPLETGLIWRKKAISYYLIDLASLLAENFDSFREIISSYEEIVPLSGDEIDLLDCFVRLEFVSSPLDDHRTTQIESLATNLIFLRSQIRQNNST